MNEGVEEAGCVEAVMSYCWRPWLAGVNSVLMMESAGIAEGWKWRYLVRVTALMRIVCHVGLLEALAGWCELSADDGIGGLPKVGNRSI